MGEGEEKKGKRESEKKLGTQNAGIRKMGTTGRIMVNQEDKDSSWTFSHVLF